MSVEITKCPKCGNKDGLIELDSVYAFHIADTVTLKCSKCEHVFKTLMYRPNRNHGRYLV